MWLLGRDGVGSDRPTLLFGSPVTVGVMEKREWDSKGEGGASGSCFGLWGSFVKSPGGERARKAGQAPGTQPVLSPHSLVLSYGFWCLLSASQRSYFYAPSPMPQMAIDFNSPQVYCEPCFRDVPLLLSNPILK